MHLSIDVMGGDLGPRPCVLAALNFLIDFPSVSIELVGTSNQIRDIISSASSRYSNLLNHSLSSSQKSVDSLSYGDRLTIIDAEQIVGMSETPAYVLRHKRSSSMSKSLERVAQNHADACISGGNTGALLALSMHHIKPNSHIKRPAICKAIPTKTGQSYLLDLGANLNCSPFALKQFALMASALVEDKAKVALLNIGVESHKGSPVTQQAADLLASTESIDFCGFIEGSKLFDGDVDVIVCDGLSGNIALKSSEGAAEFIFYTLKNFLGEGFLKKYLATLLKPCLASLNPAKFNGAMFLGLNKIVVKSHGNSDEFAFYHSIKSAHDLAQSKVIEKVSTVLGSSSHSY